MRGTQAVQLSASGRALLAQFGHLVPQLTLGGHQLGAALADGVHQKQPRLRPHRLGVRTHKIAINSYPIQRPLWTLCGKSDISRRPRSANTGLEQMQQMTCVDARLFDYVIGARARVKG